MSGGDGTPDRETGRFLPGFTPLVLAMNVAGAMIVLGMVVIVNLDVFGRWLFNAPLGGTLEMTEMGIVAVVYLQIAHAIGARRMTRSDTLLGFLGRRGNTRLETGLRAVFALGGAVMFAIIAWGQFPRLVDAWNKGFYKGNRGIFTVPTWPLEAIMLLGAVAGTVMFVLLAWRRVKFGDE